MQTTNAFSATKFGIDTKQITNPSAAVTKYTSISNGSLASAAAVTNQITGNQILKNSHHNNNNNNQSSTNLASNLMRSFLTSSNNPKSNQIGSNNNISNNNNNNGNLQTNRSYFNHLNSKCKTKSNK